MATTSTASKSNLWIRTMNVVSLTISGMKLPLTMWSFSLGRVTGAILRPRSQKTAENSTHQVIYAFISTRKTSRRLLPGPKVPGNKPETFIHIVTLFPGQLKSSSKYLNCVTYVPGIKWKLCVGKLSFSRCSISEWPIFIDRPLE